VGFMNSFSNFMATMGRPQRDTVLMLEEKINKEGGINGRPLKIIYYDDESDETKGVLAVKKLIEQDKVHALIGTAATGIAFAQAGIVEKAGVPWVTMAAARALVLPQKKWIFKMPVSERLFVPVMYNFMKSRGATKFALLNQGAGYGRQGRKYIEQTAGKAGLTLVIKEEYGPMDTDMKPQLTRIKASEAQFLLVYGAEPAGAIAVGQAKAVRLTIPILAPASLTLPFIMGNERLRRGLEGLYVATGKPDVWQQLPDNDIQKPILKTLDQQLKAKYGPKRAVSVWEAMAHDGFYLMINAIKRANPDPTKLQEARAKIREALETGTKNYVGANTIITYTPKDHEGEPRLETAVIAQIKNGKFLLVK
jgi:branched-chain amino acid transport system substrate-binding protein